MNAVELRDLYNHFLKEFPLESLKDMPLEKYTNLNKTDSFCYWLETKTEALGSAWGGSSFKFGIYKYDKTPSDKNKIQWDNDYAWYKRFGKSTAQEAYTVVRDAVIKIATCASKQDFEGIDVIDTFGDVIKWKIAFLYSNEQLIPICSKDKLVKVATHYGMANPQSMKISDIQRYLLTKKGEKDLYDFYEELLTLFKRTWVFTPGLMACDWDECVKSGRMYLGWDKLGALSQYASQQDMINRIIELYGEENEYANNGQSLWEFFNAMKPGDVVFAIKGDNCIIGRGVVSSRYHFYDNREVYRQGKNVNWENVGEWTCEKPPLEIKTLTNLTSYPDYVMKLNKLTGQNQSPEPIDPQPPIKSPEPYSKSDFLHEVFMSEKSFDTLRQLVETKKNVILQGAPGVGKTFCARRLAQAMMGVKDDSRIELIQFHQNYAYEDFVMGYKPAGNTFELKEGVFHRFCKRAESDPTRDYFFLIDEINRGNLSKIFGELLMLIENDYRGEAVTLAYRDEQFSVPQNLYLIGMMNTADRSLALIDYALRRRFSFFEMRPAFDTDGFKAYLKEKDNARLNELTELLKELNREIAGDASLGSGFEIGHSYLCTDKAVTDKWLEAVVKYDILPMLQEYWFDNPKEVDKWTDKLGSIFHD